MRAITFITDFGLKDPYVGIMKGVILSRATDVHLIDLTHEIPPQDIMQASRFLEDAYRSFPPGTIHLAVIDPGVGSARKPVVVEFNDHLFVGPDNGLFSFTTHDPKTKYWKIEATKLNSSISKTFEGRDVFAPIVGMLARGETPSECLIPIQSIKTLVLPSALKTKAGVQGEILYADHFGNLISNIQREDVQFSKAEVFINRKKIGMIENSYSDVKEHKPVALWNSMSRLEIAVRNGSALKLLKIKIKDRVEVKKK